MILSEASSELFSMAAVFWWDTYIYLISSDGAASQTLNILNIWLSGSKFGNFKTLIVLLDQQSLLVSRFQSCAKKMEVKVPKI